MSESFGQIAYEAYCNKTSGKSLVTGATLPEWDKLNEGIQEAWNAAGRAVLSSSQADIANYKPNPPPVAIKDKANPPAFPSFGLSGYSGMTLWDFYAGHALVGIAPIENRYKDTAKWVADLTDAMLEERVKRGIGC